MDTPPLIEQEITNLLKTLVKANRSLLDLNETNIRTYVDQIVNSLRVDSVCFRIIQKVGPDWMTYIDFERVLTSIKEMATAVKTTAQS